MYLCMILHKLGKDNFYQSRQQRPLELDWGQRESDEAWATAKELVNKQTWWPLTKPSVPLLNIPLHVSLILFQSSHLNLLHSWPATSDYIKSLHYPQPQVLYWNTHSLPIKSTHIYNYRPSAWTHEVVSMSNRLSLDGKLAAGPINSRQQQK